MNCIKYNVLIVDDNINDISLLKILLQKFCPNIHNILEARSNEEALQIYTNNQIDILLVDIDLGRQTIFDFVSSINLEDIEVIYISSSKDFEFALKAIEYGSTGYIMKPIDIHKLVHMVNKSISNIEKRNIQKNINIEKSEKQTFISISNSDKLHVLQITDILYAKADGAYTIFFMKDSTTYISSLNIGKYEKKLENQKFYRIHAKYLVNIREIIYLNKSQGISCVLSNSIEIPIAIRRYEAFLKFLNI